LLPPNDDVWMQTALRLGIGGATWLLVIKVIETLQ
jgi:hypothetical protein